MSRKRFAAAIREVERCSVPADSVTTAIAALTELERNNKPKGGELSPPREYLDCRSVAHRPRRACRTETPTARDRLNATSKTPYFGPGCAYVRRAPGTHEEARVHVLIEFHMPQVRKSEWCYGIRPTALYKGAGRHLSL